MCAFCNYGFQDEHELDCPMHPANVRSAASEEHLGDALSELMLIGGIDTGDVAGIVFSGMEEGEWEDMELEDRVTRLRTWLQTEAMYLEG